MKKQFVALALALAALLAIVAAAALESSDFQHRQSSYLVSAPGPASPEVQPPTQASQVSTQVTSQAQHQSAEPKAEAVVQTGCGKPTPCLGRSCEDCPHNRLLK